MPAAIPVIAGEAALAIGAEAAAIAAAEAAALQAAQVAAAEAAAQAAAVAAAEQAAATAATNLATNQSILGAIGAGGGTPASAALTGAGSGLGGAGSGLGATSSAYTGALTGTPAAYGMPPTPAGLEQIANPALTAPPPAYGMPPGTESLLPNNAPGFNQLSQAELANFENVARGAQDLATNAKDLGQVASNNLTPDMLTQGADQAASTAYDLTKTGSNIPNPAYEIRPPSVTEGLRMGPAEGIKTTLTELPKPAPSALENAFTKAMDWVKDNKITSAMGAMQLLKGSGKGGGDEKKEYDGILTKYKMSPDFQGRQADPADYQYTPKVYAEGGIMQAYAGGGPIEMMSNANAIGANTGYPMADINKGAYATPYQIPISRNVVGGVSDTGVNPMTGEMNFAGGGIASYRDGGKAAMDYYERMTKPKQASTPDKTDVGIFFDTDPDTRSLDALTAAQVRMAKVNKRANMQLPGMKRPTPMGRINLAPPGAKSQDSDVTEAAQGGIMGLGGYAAGGNPRLLKGPGDGMSDNIPATIAGKQPARLADGEFVIPADVVSHLGNGSTEAGAKKLHRMMTQVRKARTGNPKQGKQINPNKYMPK
jgi:hypothetical protein